MPFKVVRIDQDFTVSADASEMQRRELSSHDLPSVANEALKSAIEQFAVEHPRAARTAMFGDHFSELIIDYGRADEYRNVYRRTRFYLAV
jgi:hypothetical protein